MVFVRVRQYDPSNVGESNTLPTQFIDQRSISVVGLWPDVDQRQRIFLDEINIYVAHVKRRRDGDRDDLHRVKVREPL